MKHSSNHSRKFARPVVIQTVFGYVYSFVTICIMYCISYICMVCLYFFEADCKADEFDSESILLYGLISSIIFFHYFFYTLSIVISYIVAVHFIGLFRFGMYSKYYVAISTAVVFALQLKLLPTDELTHYDNKMISMFYIASIALLFLLTIIYRLLFKRQYRIWLIKNYRNQSGTCNRLYNSNPSLTERIMTFSIPGSVLLLTYFI